jgi:hypothetical protein
MLDRWYILVREGKGQADGGGFKVTQTKRLLDRDLTCAFLFLANKLHLANLLELL